MLAVEAADERSTTMARRRYLDDVTRWRIAVDAAAAARLAEAHGQLDADQQATADRHRLELPELWTRLDHLSRLHRQRPLELSYDER
jgi:hypothetical protein